MEKYVKIPWDDWTLVKSIGKGGFGEVYEIERTKHGITEKAAMKVMSIPQSAGEIENLKIEGYTDESITQRFSNFADDIIKEYGMMVQMKGNANIVYCDDYRVIQHDDGFGRNIYIKMELLTPLMKVVQQITTEDQIIRIGLDICNALVVCQRRKVIHRDIKPQNVFVSEDGVYKLGDFGIARTAERTTRGTVGIGTYQFMAPEVKNDQQYNATVDIYSLGLMLHWLLNERRSPFLPLPPIAPKHGEDEAARQRRFAGEQIPAPKNGSEALKAIVLKACAYDPKDRYQTAQEMLNALTALKIDVTPTVELVVEMPSKNPVPTTNTVEDDIPTVGPNWSNVKEEPVADDVTVGPTWNNSPAEDKYVAGTIKSLEKEKKQRGVREEIQGRSAKGIRRIITTFAVLFALVLVGLTLFLSKRNQKPQAEQIQNIDSAATSVQVHEHQPENGKCIICGEKSLKVALCFSGSGDWEIVYKNRASQLCQEYGWTCQTFFAKTAPAQIEQVNEVISENFDAMIIQATDRTALVPVITQAVNEGIIIIDHHNIMPESEVQGDIYKILLDEAAIGKCQAEEYVAKYSDKGKIAIIAGPTDSDVMAARLSGVKNVLRDCPDISIDAIRHCDLNAQAAQREAEKLITQIPGLNAIFVQDDDMVEGAVLAVEAAGKQQEIMVVSQDFAEGTIPLLQEERLLFTVAVPGASAIAEESIKRIADVSAGLKLDHVLYLNMKIIDQENVEENLNFFDNLSTDTSFDSILSTRCDSIAAGTYHSVGLAKNGTVVATNYTGKDYAQQCDVADWNDIVSISAGEGHTLGLHADGTVVAVGLNDCAQCNVYGWNDIVAVSAGLSHSVGLRSDGTVVATGQNDYGQCDVMGWSDIVAISAGAYHTVGLKADGTVVAVGDNSEKQCYVSELSNVSAIAAGCYFTVVLKNDGTVEAVGSNRYGQLTTGNWKDIVAISAGAYHTVGLKVNGTVVAVGSNFANQVNVQSWTNIVAISAGRDHTVGLKADGTAVAVGHNGNGQCDVGSWTSIRTP